MRSWPRISISGAVALAFLLIEHGVRAQSEGLPTVDTSAGDQGSFQAEHPQREAWFGYSMASGKLDGPEDELDDVVICAPQEDNGTGPDSDEIGAVYVFENVNLTPPQSKPKRLLATNPDNGCQLGILAMAIGNPRGDDESSTPYPNLILIGCYQHDAHYPGLGDVTDGGSVEMYNWFGSDVQTTIQKSLFAPLNPPGTTLYDGKPQEVKQFGHGLDLGDVTGDGIDDLVVGAPGASVEESGDGEGRIYVFEGHGLLNPGTEYEVGDFYEEPLFRWTGIDAVEPMPDPDPLSENWGKTFGFLVAVCHFTDSATREVLVSRPDRGTDATETALQNPPYQKEPKGGSAYVFRGSYLSELLYGLPYDLDSNPDSTVNRVNRPPWPDVTGEGGLDQNFPEYQVIRNPFGDSGQADGGGRVPLWADAFGWFVYRVGDVGSPDGTLDGVEDAAIYAELADYIGTGDLDHPQKSGVGGLWVVYGTGTNDTQMVYDDDSAPYDHGKMVLLERPGDVTSEPQSGGRFGRAVARADLWYDPLTDELEPGLFVGESSATWPPIPDPGAQTLAGTVYLFRLPLPAPSGTPLYAVTIDNAWGSNPLVEYVFDTSEVGPGHLLGSWIVVLDHNHDSSHPGQELIVSSRQANVLDGTILRFQAGRAIAYMPASQ